MLSTKFNKNISFNTLILNFKHCWIKYVVISDCLWNNSEEVRFPQHFKEELYNSQVCRQDHECVVRLHHLPLPRGRHRQSQARVAHRICILDPHPLYIHKVFAYQDNLKFHLVCLQKNNNWEKTSILHCNRNVRFQTFQIVWPLLTFRFVGVYMLSSIINRRRIKKISFQVNSKLYFFKNKKKNN